MQPLTPDAWSENFATLRPRILEEWPRVAQQDLESVRGDWQGLLELLQRTSGLDAEVIEQRVRTIDLDEGTDTAEAGGASLAQLRLGTGFSETERDRVVARLDKLNRRLKRFPADGTELEISVKDRETPSQTVTLTASLPGFAPMVATSHEADLRDALADVRHDLWRQIDDAVSKRSQAVR